MDSKDFSKAAEQLKKGYKRQLQDILLQGLVFFDYDFIQSAVQDVFDAASENSHSDINPIQEVIDSSHDMDENLPF